MVRGRAPQTKKLWRLQWNLTNHRMKTSSYLKPRWPKIANGVETAGTAMSATRARVGGLGARSAEVGEGIEAFGVTARRQPEGEFGRVEFGSSTP